MLHRTPPPSQVGRREHRVIGRALGLLLTGAMLAYGYRPISVRQTFGDSSRAVAANGVIKDPSGGQTSVTSVRILYALANVAVQISIEDEPQNVDPLDAVELANRELQYLRLSAPLAPK